MAQSNHGRGTRRQAHRRTLAGAVSHRVAHGLFPQRQGISGGLARDHLNQNSIGIGQTHHLAAARPVEGLDRHAFGGGEFLKICDTLGPKPDGDEARLTLLRHMQDRRGPRAAGEQEVFGFAKGGQAKSDDETLHLVQIGRRKPHVRNVFDLHQAHAHLPFLTI